MYSRNVRASGTLKIGYEGDFKILTTGSISLLAACPRRYHYLSNQGFGSGVATMVLVPVRKYW